MSKHPLLDIFNPLHNIREVCKEFVLLEDHLVVPGKHCPDCIRKHLLRAEAFAEEAIALDKSGQYLEQISFLPQKIRDLGTTYSDGTNKHALGQEIRFLRKALSPICFAKGSRSAASFDFWSAVSNAVGVPETETEKFMTALKRSSDFKQAPYFRIYKSGVAAKVRSKTPWVRKELSRILQNSPVKVLVSRAVNNGQKFSIKDYQTAIMQALGKTFERLDVDGPASSLGEYIANRKEAKFALEKALNMKLLGLIRRARKSEKRAAKYGCSPHGLQAATFYSQIGKFTKEPYFHAKAANLYERCGKNAEEIIELRNILLVSPNHVLRFYIVNKVVIAEKTADREIQRLLPRKNQHTGDPIWFDRAKKLAPIALGIAIGLV